MKNILCVGGSGQLGTRVLACMKNYNLINIDYSVNSMAQNNILLNPELSVVKNNINSIKSIKKMQTIFDAMIVTAGGWMGGSIKDDNYHQTCSKMIEVNLAPSMLTAFLASKYLKQKGLLIFTGAGAVFKQPQPDMIGYAISKTAVHSLAMSIAQKQKQTTVITILPDVIDTESNRKAMPNADFNKWASPDKIGQLLRTWVDGYNVPNSGSFVLLEVQNGSINTRFV